MATPAEAVQLLMDMARQRPDPKAVATWLTAYLGKRPADAKRAALDGIEKELNARTIAANDARSATLVLKTVQRVRDGIR